jgi:hypothetical protein
VVSRLNPAFFQPFTAASFRSRAPALGCLCSICLWIISDQIKKAFVSAISALVHSVEAQTRLTGQFALKPLQCFEDFIRARLTPNMHSLIVLYQVNLITRLQAKFSHKVGGQTDSQITPQFCDSHLVLSRFGETTFNVRPSCSKSKPIAVPVLRGKYAYKPSQLNLLSSNILKNHPVRIDPAEPSTNDTKPVSQQVSLPCFRKKRSTGSRLYYYFHLLNYAPTDRSQLVLWITFVLHLDSSCRTRWIVAFPF